MFYYYATMFDHTIRFERESTVEEFTELKPHISRISQMLVDKRRINIVVNAHKNMIAEFDNLTSGKKAPHDSYELIFALTYYLAAFKKYVDNWETYLKRTFGKKSKEVKLFKAVQGHEYDHHIEYRILYRLRNYDQHCGNLVSRIAGKVLPDGSHQYLILADRDQLLKDFDEWKPEEVVYLKSQESKFEIRPLIDIFHNCILSIHEQIMQIHFTEEFFRSCATIIAAAKEFDREDDTYFISYETEIDWGNLDLEGNNLQLTYLEVPTCKRLLEIYFRNNVKNIKILYHGKNLKKRIGRFSHEIDQTTMQKIASSQLPFVNLNGQRMTRLFSHISFSQNEIYCVLANPHFPKNNLDRILELWKFLLESIIIF